MFLTFRCYHLPIQGAPYYNKFLIFLLRIFLSHRSAELYGGLATLLWQVGIASPSKAVPVSWSLSHHMTKQRRPWSWGLWHSGSPYDDTNCFLRHLRALLTSAWSGPAALWEPSPAPMESLACSSWGQVAARMAQKSKQGWNHHLPLLFL